MLRAHTRIGSGVAAFCTKFRIVPRARILGSTAGFTLLEAILSSLLVAIAVIGVLAMFSNGQTTVYSGGQNRIAAQLAQQRIEEIRAAGFGPKYPLDPRLETDWTAVPGNPGYERKTEVSDVCSTNFTILYNNGGCTPALPEAQTRIFVVTVRVVGAHPNDVLDPQTTPVVLQTVLTRR